MNTTCQSVLLLAVVLCAGQSGGQVSPQKLVSPEVALKPLSAEVTRFEHPIRIGPPNRAIEYQRALVFKVQVDRQQFDSLPPDIEPFLYIGPEEYRIFNIDRRDDRKELILTFHIRNWEKLVDGAPIVLTTDHGAPIRNQEKYRRLGGPRFSKSTIVEKQ
jgi:hypothetical protein